MKKRLYLDTSAYLCVILGEAGARELAAEFDGQTLLSSSLLVLEARRNLVRLAREGALDAMGLQDALDRVRSDVERMRLRDLDLELCLSVVMPVLTTPRSLDLAHLRTAWWFHQQEPIHRFVTLDGLQRQAARELGLPV